MRVLVTGAAGFIGTHLCRHLESLGADVMRIDIEECDVLDTERLRSIMAEGRPEAVYHLAAMASVADSWARPMDAWQTNVLGTVSVLEAVRTAVPAARVLLMSTASVYDGAQLDGPVDEHRPVQPISPYGTSKAATELLSQQYLSAYGTPVLVARPSNVIGPGQLSSYVVPALCQRILHAKAASLPSITIGNLEAERDFVDVRDAVVGLTQILARGTPGHIYNVCTGVGIMVGALARQLGRLVNAKVEVLADPALHRRIDAKRLVGDPTRTSREVGWKAQTPLSQTLTDVLAAVGRTNGSPHRLGEELPRVDARK